jgi:hypothetical protein
MGAVRSTTVIIIIIIVIARKLKKEYEKWGIAINLDKTNYVFIGERNETLKFDGGKEIQLCTECSYLGTKIL